MSKKHDVLVFEEVPTTDIHLKDILLLDTTDYSPLDCRKYLIPSEKVMEDFAKRCNEGNVFGEFEGADLTECENDEEADARYRLLDENHKAVIFSNVRCEGSKLVADVLIDPKYIEAGAPFYFSARVDGRSEDFCEDYVAFKVKNVITFDMFNVCIEDLVSCKYEPTKVKIDE